MGIIELLAVDTHTYLTAVPSR